MQGLHLTADLHHCQCQAAWLVDAAVLGPACLSAVLAAGLNTVGKLLHKFPSTSHGPGGITATLLLAESHLCVHTWPEQKAVTLDVYVCNFGADHSAKAQALMQALVALFQPLHTERHSLQRGAASHPGLQPAVIEPGPQPALPENAAGSICAMVLAAGRGERMRPLTDTLPKPLLAVHGKPLMQWHLEALARSGIGQVVVNTAWLGHKIEDVFGRSSISDNGIQLSISYSHEGMDFGSALETAGGVVRALPLLNMPPHQVPLPHTSPPGLPPAATAALALATGDGIFWLVAGDVFVPEFTFPDSAVQRFRASHALAHLWLVPNPAHHPRGDFGLGVNGLAINISPDPGLQRFTYSTIGLYRAALFTPPFCPIAYGNPQGVHAALAPLLRSAMDQGRVSAEIYSGAWTDVGTPQRLAELNQHTTISTA